MQSSVEGGNVTYYKAQRMGGNWQKMRMEGKQGLDHKPLPAMVKIWSLFKEE